MTRDDVKLAFFIFLIGLTLVSITYGDYLITGLSWFPEYGFGGLIPFSWLKLWWLITAILFFIVACLATTAYLLYREETKRHKLTAFMIWLTVMWQNLSGNLDFVWFIMDAIKRGGSPWISWDTIWTWSMFYWKFGIEWTTKHQMFATAVMNIILVLIWIYYGFYLKHNKK